MFVNILNCHRYSEVLDDIPSSENQNEPPTKETHKRQRRDDVIAEIKCENNALMLLKAPLTGSGQDEDLVTPAAMVSVSSVQTVPGVKHNVGLHK